MASWEALFLTTELNELQTLEFFFRALGFEADISYHEDGVPRPYAEAIKPEDFLAIAQKPWLETLYRKNWGLIQLLRFIFGY